ncbi:MAG: dihydrolipoamide acetyltransferase family protein [Anaerolineae bacterium]|jgi:pyruvate dehydrogenase E2 component (dihydrolipoamide acetyltransferase)|nr:2-oxo acid dehydrogenase subunit E2 [Chloroflexota bacterium]
MANVVTLPKLGQTVELGTITEWVVNEGDTVNRGDVLFMVETDKAVLDAESRYRGTVLKILVPVGQEVPVLTPVAIIGEPGEDIAPLLAELAGDGAAVDGASQAERPVEEPETLAVQSAAESAVGAGGRVLASPRARRLAGERRVDLAQLTGTGPEGRIIEADVLAWLEAQPAATPLATSVAASMGVPLASVPVEGRRVLAADVVARAASGAKAEPVAATAAEAAPVGGEVTPLRGIRAIIAERMANSAHTTASITLHSEVDATEFVAAREALKAELAEELGFSVGYNDLLGLIVARCLVEFPYMNVQLTSEGIRQMPGVNVGLAVDTERGLVVPVVRDADQRGLKDFARTFRELVERARAGRSTPDELSGGTFTITNLGMYGVDMFTPIINLPECAILGVGRIRPVPSVIDGQIVVRQKMWLSLSVDHRLVDGAPAARFLQGIARYITSPCLLIA